MADLDLSQNDVMSLLEKIKGVDWQLINYEIKAISESPIGFLGNHFCLKIKTIKNEIETESAETLQFFIKAIPQDDSHAQYVDEIGAFKKEVYLQKELLPKLLESTSFLEHQWSPMCHIVKDTLLLFDDLTLNDYKLAPGREIFDFQHCVAALKTLADFHAASIIWEENNKRNGEKLYLIKDLYPEAVTEICYIHEKGHIRNKWLESVTSATEHLCKLIGRSGEVERVQNIVDHAVSVVGPSNKWRNVLSHADLWSNNFMFKYNEDGSIKHCALVDYQLARYAPVALDLTCCLHLIAPLHLRTNHMGYLVTIYYERLSEVLSTANLDITDLIPRTELVEGCEQYKITGIVEAIFYGTTIWIPNELSTEIYTDSDNFMDLLLESRSKFVEKAFYEDSFFRNQMTDLVKELLDCTAHII